MTVLPAVLSAVAAMLVAAMFLGVLPDRIETPRRRRVREGLQLQLRQAGVDITPLRFWALGMASSFGVFAVVFLLTGLIGVALAPAGFAALGPRFWITRRAAARRQAVQRAWPDAIRDVVASVGAGMSLHRALANLGTSGPGPLRPTFVRFASVAQVAGIESALLSIRDDLADPTSDRVIEVLRVAAERGGAIVPEILRDLAASATRDLWVLDEIETESLEQRINARAVFVLPWLVLLAVTVQDGPFREFYRTPGGLLVILVGAFASAVGMVLVTRLGASPAEPRVLVRR